MPIESHFVSLGWGDKGLSGQKHMSKCWGKGEKVKYDSGLSSLDSQTTFHSITSNERFIQKRGI